MWRGKNEEVKYVLLLDVIIPGRVPCGHFYPTVKQWTKLCNNIRLRILLPTLATWPDLLSSFCNLHLVSAEAGYERGSPPFEGVDIYAKDTRRVHSGKDPPKWSSWPGCSSAKLNIISHPSNALTLHNFMHLCWTPQLWMKQYFLNSTFSLSRIVVV